MTVAEIMQRINRIHYLLDMYDDGNLKNEHIPELIRFLEEYEEILLAKQVK